MWGVTRGDALSEVQEANRSACFGLQHVESTAIVAVCLKDEVQDEVESV